MNRCSVTRLLAIFALAGCATLSALAQAPQQQQAAPPINQTDDPILKSFVWRSIGPASMGGRIDDIEAVEGNWSTYYVGYATGGIWKTVNNGTTFTPIFDTYSTHSIGDIAIAPSNPNIIYVGTGEPNNRQSSSFGDGVYKSTDGGKTFTNVGLRETQSIGRVVVHPKDPNIVYVAAVGHLFGPNPERGLYKTTDGGKTWTNTNFIDNDTGFTDVVMDPSDPNVLYAASYQRRRQPWGFNGGGPGSALWKTTNGGKTWTKLVGNGLPTNPIIGRIGIDICRTKPNVIYAQIEVGASGGTGAGVADTGGPAQPGGERGAGAAAAGVQPAGGRGAQQPAAPNPDRSGVWRSDDKGKTWRLMSNNNNRPMYYSQIRVDPNNPEIVYTCGAPFHKSTDGGKTFRQVQNIAHSDHHAVWINPRNSNHLMIGTDGGLDVTYDQAETWEFINIMATGQFYAVSADMRKPYYVCGGLQDNGSWCGPSAVRDSNGILNSHWFRVGGGDGFYTAQDPTNHNIVYYESQDGNTSRVDLRTGENQSIRPRPPQASRGGGAGGQQAQQQQQLQQLAAQLGLAGRGAGTNIVPVPPEGTQYRFFWNTPFILSPHNPSVIYLGGDRLFKSFNRGDTWMASPDLTRNISRFVRPLMGVAGDAPMASKHDGVASYSNIVTISESPVVPGVVWVGTNDGNLQISRDGGATWKNVVANVKGVPDETHVSRVEASHFDAGTCYVTFDGHRTDDHKPYVFVTRDFGATWASIAGNLPMGNVNVIREDPRNPNLLYLGTEYALYISLDGGKEWKRFMNGLPVVRIDDLLVHPRDNDLIAGTHGRSIWIADDISALQQLTPEVLAKDAHLFSVRPAVNLLQDWTLRQQVGASKHFRGQNPEPGTAIAYYLKGAAKDLKIEIVDVTGRVVRTFSGCADEKAANCAPRTAGLNRVQWNLRGDPPQPPAGAAGRGGAGGFGGRGGGGPALGTGTYVVRLVVDGKTMTTMAVVEPDRIERD
ncbi:MAG: WD40/YVTN/BNR-like repeat-containing protein [Vicinamibacterales bacterium]